MTNPPDPRSTHPNQSSYSCRTDPQESTRLFSSEQSHTYGTHANAGRNYSSIPSYDSLPPDRKKEPSLSNGSVALCLVLIFLSVISSVSLDRIYNDILYPNVRDDIRMRWNIEEVRHQRAMEHAHDQEQQWKVMEQKWKVEMDEWSEKKAGWRREEEEWDRKWNEMERRAREEAERVEKEKRERERMHIYWEDIQGEENCIAHRTKRYSARLANLRNGVDALDACKATPLTIHGVTYDSPVHCEDRRSYGGGIHGQWVDNDEPFCSTFWEYFKIKDCLAPGSGLRRVESPLGNLRSGDNWQDMCYSTPATLFGRSYNGPTAGCVDWGKYGHWGIWDVPDENCMYSPPALAGVSTLPNPTAPHPIVPIPRVPLISIPIDIPTPTRMSDFELKTLRRFL